MKGTGEAGTKRICLALQFVTDLKGGSCTTRTQSDILSGAIIELPARCNIVTIVKALVISTYACIAKKWRSWHWHKGTSVSLHRCNCNGFQTIWGSKRFGFVMLNFWGFTYDYDQRYSVPGNVCSYPQLPLRPKFIFAREMLQRKMNVASIVLPWLN